MDNSIENTWREGFLQDKALVAPRLNKLYDQKSNHLIDRLLRLGKRNIIGIVIGAVIVLLGFSLAGSWPAGLGLFLLLIGLAYYTQIQGKKLAQIDKGENSYQYLTKLKLTLQEMMENYIHIYRWVYPAIILLFSFGMLNSSYSVEVIAEQFPGVSTILGVPTAMFVCIMLFALTFSVLAKRIFQEDVGLIYGPLLRKLEEMITDMEHLR